MMKKWIPIWVIPVVLVLAIGTVWLRLHVVDTTYLINQADRRIQNLKQEREKTELKLAGLRSPKRLETLAKTRFALSLPKADQVVHLK